MGCIRPFAQTLKGVAPSGKMGLGNALFWVLQRDVEGLVIPGDK